MCISEPSSAMMMLCTFCDRLSWARNARLNWQDSLRARLCPYEVAVAEIKSGLGGVLVSVNRDRFPPVVFKPVILLERFGHTEHFDVLCRGLRVDDACIELEI